MRDRRRRRVRRTNLQIASRMRDGLAPRCFEQNHYVGAAPVPVEQYRRYMAALARRRACMPAARACASLRAGRQPAGDGPARPGDQRRALDVRLRASGERKNRDLAGHHSLQTGDIAIPRALEVEGSIIRFFDPVNHQELPQLDSNDGIHSVPSFDQRWVRCRRPMVMVGGELTARGARLAIQSDNRVYQAPIRRSPAAVLVIDDFGRQSCSPRDLLNRWIVPLESRVDFMTLQTGQKFDLPFTALVVFATNLKPQRSGGRSVSPAYSVQDFRRSPSVEEFIKIFENYCREADVPFDRALVEHMLQHQFRPKRIQLRGCQPRDLINQALSLADYRDEPRRLTNDLLEAACAGLFRRRYRGAPVYA